MSKNNNTRTFLNGLSITTFFTIIGSVLGLVYFSAMSRLLSKVDFGYFAALTGIMAVISSLSDAGLGSAVIQKKNATKDYISTAFTLSLIVGLTCWLFIFFCAPYLVRLVADETLVRPLRLMSITLLFHCFLSIGLAQLYREKCFKKVSIIGFFSNLTTIIFSIILAYYGAGLYAMIFYIVANPILKTVLIYIGNVKIPKLKIVKEDVHSIFSFGGWLTLSTICNNISNQIDRLFLPKLASVEILGAYTRPTSFAYNISRQITDVFDKVLFPMLAEMQDDKSKTLSVFYRAIELLNTISVVLACSLFFNSELLIYIFFGKEWLSLVPILMIVSITTIFLIDSQLVDCFFRSLNLVKYGFYLRLCGIFWNLLWVVIGSKFGLYGIAISLTFSNICIIMAKVVTLSIKIDASLLLVLKKWLVAFKPSLILILIGIIYLFMNHNLLIDIMFAVLFGICLLVEFLFFPQFVGKEYNKTIYPYLKTLTKKLNKNGK